MQSNEIIKQQIIEVVENQLRNNTPPQTKQTYVRLLQNGFTSADAKLLIGQCVAVELFSILKERQPFNEVRFVRNLAHLPEEPFEDE